MTVTKYKSVYDMPATNRVDEGDLIERIRTLWNRAFALSPPDFTRGVTRFRNMDQANQARALVVAHRMQRIAAAKKTPPEEER